ncbi:MAG TPA: N-acetyl-gamma-glutamyl-phosphate reductase [Syntrophales bacterium]|nr:N-acetyl-gamma-glutamyl-phosphate reductase [Syntrophales bacterium]
MIRVGIYGGSGYTGLELMRILLRHPDAEVVGLTSRKFKGKPLSETYPLFEGLTDIRFIDASPEELARMADVIFMATPHGEAMAVAPAFIEAGKKVIDLSADFRLRNLDVFEKWYHTHSAPGLAKKAVYGIPELYRDEIRKADLVANPGCYPTSAILGLAPALRGKIIDPATIIIDSKSGVSGAGRDPVIGSLFCEVDEGFKAYKVNEHRHGPEIEQELSALAGSDVKVLFTPHLLPLNRGILSTMYASLNKSLSTDELIDLYKEFYKNESFVRVLRKGMYPNVSSVKGTNFCHIGLSVDARTNRVIILSAIDNLVKGASGQAVQNMNLMCGLREDAALDMIALFP